MDNDNLIYNVYFALALAAFYAILLVIVLIIFGRLLKLVFKKNSESRSLKIIATSVTCIIYNDTLHSVIIAPLSAILSNLQSLSYELQSYIRLMSADQSQKTLDSIPTSNSNISVNSILLNFPLAQFISAVAFAFLLFYCLNYLKKRVTISNSPHTEVNSNSLVYNLIIIGTLLLSLFFVISVCITIPYLSEIRKPSVFTKERLDSVLNRMSNKDSFKVVTGSSAFLDSPVNKMIIVGDIEKQYARASKDGKKQIDLAIQNLQNIDDETKINRNSVISSLNNYANQYRSKEERYKQSLSLKFEEALQNLTTDKSTLFQFSIDAFDNFVQSEKENFQTTLRDINSKDQFNMLRKNRVDNQIRDLIAVNDTTSIKTAIDSGNGHLPTSYFAVDPFYDNYSNFIVDKGYNTYLPNYVKDGSDWGFFGLISRYLIRTQSSELVLLIGMFGFGLLGASLLSFNKNDADENFVELFGTKPLISNFGSVITRGFGAALVVYLATKGGLAIFSAGTSTDANGYILLLTCFVGAVFSEKVWDKISSSLYGSSSSNINVGIKSGDNNSTTRENDSHSSNNSNNETIKTQPTT